jgi:hypothetical protein
VKISPRLSSIRNLMPEAYVTLSRLQTLVISLTLLPLLAACNQAADSQQTTAAATTAPAAETFTVYKQATCGCCEEWMSRVEEAGLDVTGRDVADLNAIKDQYQIAPRYQSCHTAVSSQGYVFEGHIPARYIQEFLANPPADAIGLAVPGMPLGSPGMEVGDRFTPYEVLLLKKDGSSEVFASVASAGEQVVGPRG